MTHNLLEMPNPDAARTDTNQAAQYRYFRASDAGVDKLANPWRPLEIDPKMRYFRERARYLVLARAS